MNNLDKQRADALADAVAIMLGNSFGPGDQDGYRKIYSEDLARLRAALRAYNTRQTEGVKA